MDYDDNFQDFTNFMTKLGGAVECILKFVKDVDDGTAEAPSQQFSG
jgi:hypothetical protein